ncbi:ATP-binding protein [Aquabacterium sp. A08]|uniref:sensor histidine kinase n=1 Tax=Aquabacterium sp. A08 TaxID=2718532 RepID=UPI00141E3A8E|nr:ATP-binding protein [Aquabacterium sp. A08]NIC40285.1 PAS domain-containing protein [Aquabacterium sp. A08]
MSPSPLDDKLPESFFAALYPPPDAPEPATAPAGTAPGGLLERLIENWPGAVFCLDPRLNCLLANREARSWCLGLDGAAPTLPRPLYTLLDERLTGVLLPYLSAALRGLEMGVDETFTHPRLGERSLAVRVQPDHDGGHIAGVFLHLQDTTDLRLAAALAEHPPAPAPRTDHEAHLRLLADGLRDAAIFFLDAEGHIHDWPPSAERLLGHRPEQVLGQPLHTLAAPGADPADDPADDPLRQGLERAALLGQSETPGWQRRADGQAFWAQTLLTALHDPASGALSGYACLMRDTTEVKRLVDLLQALNQALEARVAERTQQLEAINQDLEAFSYSVSHDLRAPLRHIASYLELLREDLGPDTPAAARQDLDRIDAAARHMGALIEGLLAFSRLGRAPLQPRPVAMGALLQSSLNRVQHDPALRRPDGEVRWTLPADLPEVRGDGLLLSQVWDNLLANALKYSRPRQPAQIEVGWRPGDGAAEAVFWVRDNGVGFDPKRADQLFGVFQRLHRASEFEGTGIGLALCRRIVERHGGRIWADGRVGAGSTFWFALPTGGPDAAPPQAGQAG